MEDQTPNPPIQEEAIQGIPLDISSENPSSVIPPEPTSGPNGKSPIPKVVIITVALMIIAGIGLIAFSRVSKPTAQAKTTPTPVTINTQSLDNGTLNKLTAKTPDQTKQQLTITPDTLFKNSLQVQGPLKADKQVDIGGDLSVNGTTALQKGASINGNVAIHGALGVGGALTAASISVGTLSITTINVSGSLSFGGHIVPGGAVPAVKASSAAGGGSVSINGNDTSGTITVNIGSSPIGPGELVQMTFRSPFVSTPKVQITPINSSAASARYYSSRSTTFMTIDTASAPSAGESYVFDYLVTQ